MEAFLTQKYYTLDNTIEIQKWSALVTVTVWNCKAHLHLQLLNCLNHIDTIVFLNKYLTVLLYFLLLNFFKK